MLTRPTSGNAKPKAGIYHSLTLGRCGAHAPKLVLLAIFAILALVNKMWLQLRIFALLFVSGAVIMLLSVHILFWIDILKELVENQERIST